ncbi:MAG: GntR family transcriptional regulator [Gemmatimonadota bacterium]|jgi:hypothetical protein|nr:GntR family transcriptional regulator [Gemmatimonadota bacterium]
MEGAGATDSSGHPLSPPAEGQHPILLDTLDGGRGARGRPTTAALIARFRERLAGAVYAGDLRAGDRLPSIREFALHAGINRKTAERAYRVLEAEGVVELRARSGVFLSIPASEEVLPAAPPEWFSRMVASAADQPEGLVAMPALVRRYLGAREISCACVDATEDLRVGLTGELRRRFGLRVYPLRCGSLTDPKEEERITRDLADVDLVVTTPYHASLARLARAIGKPVAIVVPEPSIVDAIRSRLENGPVNLLCVDREFGDRLAKLLSASTRDRLRIIPVGDGEAMRVVDRSIPLLITEAAGSALSAGRAGGIEIHPRYLGADSSGTVGRLIARLNAETGDPQ